MAICRSANDREPLATACRLAESNARSEHLVPARRVRDRYSICAMTLHRWLRKPGLNFPDPIIVNRRRYWRLADLVAWEEAQAGCHGQRGRT